MSEKLIPLYCLTGFVGSGKTTALLSILKQNPGKKIGVIFTEPSIFKSHDLMNEEDISIEHLENGSLQCSCSEDAIVRALHFMQQCQPEMVFIEVAGLSDPIHIKHILEQERTAPNSTLLTEHYEMQGIICLVDADNFMEQIQDVEMIRLQLCHCHLAVINKADLVPPSCSPPSKHRSVESIPTATSPAAPTADSVWSCWKTTCSPTPPMKVSRTCPPSCVPTRLCSTASIAFHGKR